MSNQITGRLASIGQPQEIPSKNGGNPLVKREFLLDATTYDPYTGVRSLLLGYFGSEYGCSLEEAKIDFYKRTCNRDLYERKTVNKKGKEVTYLRSSAELTTSEMTLSIDRFRNWSASVAGVYLPAANEQQMLIFAQQEIERNKDFI